MQYKIINGSVSYGSDTVLEAIDLEINDREKIAIVGRNGCGKTTLLKALMGEVVLEAGTGENDFRVIKTGSPQICYLRQTPFTDESLSMVDEVRKVFSHLIEMEEQMKELVRRMDAGEDETAVAAYSNLHERYLAEGGLTYEKEYRTMLRHFGFSETDEKKPLSEFSGGQRTKIAFVKMLLSKPDVLLLDEPTNHLDIETIEWLEEYLKQYSSALVIVSHDRLFLDRIVNKVYEIEWGEVKCYRGNYADFERQKKENYERQMKNHLAQQAEIARLERLIERFRYKATKAKMVQSKIKQLEHMKIISAPDRANTKSYRTRFQPDLPSSRLVLEARELSVGYDKPLATVNLRVERGQRLGIIGLNGIGKSTLLKTLVGKIPPLSGEFSFGYNTEVAYFDQQLAQIDGDETVFDLFAREYPRMKDSEIRSTLGAFQFSGEEVFRPASTLSGGEKVRLTLCKILNKHPNVLVLDEPTNHMDIIGKQSLEEILTQYEGTVIFVSHDRYFVRKLADRLLVFENDGARYYDVGFDVYTQRRLAEAEKQTENTIGSNAAPRPAKAKHVSPQKEIDRKRKRIDRLELFIEETEGQIADLESQTLSPDVYSNYQRLKEIQDEIDVIREKLSTFEDEWTVLSEELEELLKNFENT